MGSGFAPAQGAGAGVSSASLDSVFGSTQGSILYRGASAWSVLTPGTSGFFLKTQGASANPIWAAAGAVTNMQTAYNGGGDIVQAGGVGMTFSSATNDGSTVLTLDKSPSGVQAGAALLLNTGANAATQALYLQVAGDGGGIFGTESGGGIGIQYLKTGVNGRVCDFEHTGASNADVMKIVKAPASGTQPGNGISIFMGLGAVGTSSGAAISVTMDATHSSGNVLSSTDGTNTFTIAKNATTIISASADVALQVVTSTGRAVILASPGSSSGGFTVFNEMVDSHANAAGAGGGISFAADVNTADYHVIADVKANKLNGTADDRRGYLVTSMNTSVAPNTDTALAVLSVGYNSTLGMTTAGVMGFTASASDPTAALDTGISRSSAGVLAIGTGAQGSTAGSLSTGSGTFGSGLTLSAGTFTVTSAIQLRATGGIYGAVSGGIIGFTGSTTDPTASLDTSMSRSSAGVMQFGTGAANAGGAIATGSISLNSGGLVMGANSKITTYAGVATAGEGVADIRAQANITAQSGQASIVAYTNPAADADYEVSAQMNVTASTALTTTITCVYTDVANSSRTLTMPITAENGTMVTAGAITGAGATRWCTPVMHIRAKASTSITLSTSAGTFTGVTYSASGVIKKTS